VNTLQLREVVVVGAKTVVSRAQEVQPQVMAREVPACTIEAADVDGAEVSGVVRPADATMVTGQVHGRRRWKGRDPGDG
jgi:hypothetical protein